MSNKDQELSLEDLGELDLSEPGDGMPALPEDEGLDLNLGSTDDLSLGTAEGLEGQEDPAALDDLNFDAPEELASGDLTLSGTEMGDMDLGTDLSLSESSLAEGELSLGSFSLNADELAAGTQTPAQDEPSGLTLVAPMPKERAAAPASDDEFAPPLDVPGGGVVDAALGGLDYEGGDDLLASPLSKDSAPETEFSEDAMKKLKEIDRIMETSGVHVVPQPDALLDGEELDADEVLSADPEKPLVPEGMDLEKLDLAGDSPEEEAAPAKEKKKPRQKAEAPARDEKPFGQELRELTGAYSGEMERAQATIANLRSDREELLSRIEKLEDERLVHNRQTLSLRAELDEKKIELSIIRRKLNDEINELKDKMRLHDERRLILEEKNRALLQELDKAGQKNKIDLKKVQLRERELEQKLELLKSDAESQIRHRDLKILELKRRIDAMEFDMESITTQEKRSVESRFELEGKLDKAIKTLRRAISMLENEGEKSSAIDALKKNIDV